MSVEDLWDRLRAANWEPLKSHQSPAYEVAMKVTTLGRAWQLEYGSMDVPCPGLLGRYREQVEFLVAQLEKPETRQLSLTDIPIDTHQVERSLERILWEIFGLSTDEIWWLTQDSN